MEDHEIKFMLGTGGGPDYLLFAQRGNIGLGLKMLCEVVQTAEKTGTFFGGRIRSAQVPGNGTTEDDDGVVHLPEELALDTAWPTIKFGKVDSYRASTVVGMGIPLIPFQHVQLHEIFQEKDIPGMLVNYLKEMVPEEFWVVPVDFFKEKISEWLAARFEEFASKYPPPKEEHDETSGMGKVLTFPQGVFNSGKHHSDTTTEQEGEEELAAEEADAGQGADDGVDTEDA